MSGQICRVSYQKEDLKGHNYLLLCYVNKEKVFPALYVGRSSVLTLGLLFWCYNYYYIVAHWESI